MRTGSRLLRLDLRYKIFCGGGGEKEEGEVETQEKKEIQKGKDLRDMKSYAAAGSSIRKVWMIRGMPALTESSSPNSLHHLISLAQQQYAPTINR